MWVGLPSLILCVAKGYVETTSKLTFLGRAHNWLLMLLRQTADLGLISVCHYWIYMFLCRRYGLPAFPINLFFGVVLFDMFRIGIYEFEFARVNMMELLPSVFTSYAGRLGSRAIIWTDPVLFAGYRLQTGSSSLNVAIETILDSPILWASIVLCLLAWLICSLLLVFKYWRLIIASMSYSFGRYSVAWDKRDDSDLMVWKPAHPWKNAPFIVSHVLAAISAVLLLVTIFTRADSKLALFSELPYTETLLLAFTHFEKFGPKGGRPEFLKAVRHYLPPGRRWLDTRPNPVYPAVHADLEAFCAYHPLDDECKDFTPSEKKPLTKMPNVVFIGYESFTPSFNLISKDFIVEHANTPPSDSKSMITDTLYYSADVMPNMRSYQKYAVTFSGTASFGIPTASGLIGLFTGIPPAQSYGLIVDAALLHSDDVASAIGNMGYRSFVVGSTEFRFDGQNNWFNKRPAREEALNRLKCIEGQEDFLNDPLHMELLRRAPSGNIPRLRRCHPDDVNKLTQEIRAKGLDVPRWYDAIYNYYPVGRMAELVNISESTVRTDGVTWPADRLTASMFKRHWQQAKEILQRKNESKPIFGTYLTVESHMPYLSYDKEEYYDPISKHAWSNPDRLKEARFIRVNKYADKYGIKPVLDFLKETDPHTIFVITGDHGTRDIPVRETDSPIVGDVVYSSDCVHHSSGTDSFYITSAMIGYLGDDPVVKKVMGLDKHAGKTVKVPNDHGDVVYTLLDILAQLNGTSLPPTHRRSRNLMNLTSQIAETIEKKGVEEAVAEIDRSGWRGISSATFNLEYREGMKVLRTHPSDPAGAHFYNQTSFPLCMRKKSEPPMKLGTPEARSAYKRMFKFLQAETHLSYYNRMYNYGFRNETCIKNKDCRWKEPIPLRFHDWFFVKLLFMIPVAAVILLAIPVEIFIAVKWPAVKYNQQNVQGNSSDDLLSLGQLYCEEIVLSDDSNSADAPAIHTEES